MTTPAINQNINAIMTNTYVTVDRFTGAVISSGTLTNMLGVKKKVRPKSVSSPVRGDKTRKPTAWYHRWSSVSGLDGEYSANSGTLSRITSKGPLLFNGAIWDPTQEWVGPLMRNARLATLSKATAATASSNAALAQAKDLVKMAAQYTKRAAQGLDNLYERHGKSDLYKQAIAQGKQIPNDYLAYLYGLAPLGDDIAGCLDRLTNARTKGLSYSMILKGKKQVRARIERFAGVHHGTGTATIAFPCNVITSCSCKYRFDLPSWFMDQVPTIAPFSTAYQLTRMSFVLDWFLPVGDYIGALESAQFSPYFKEGSETVYVQESAIFGEARPFGGASPRLKMSGRSINGLTQRTVVNSYPSSILTRPALNPFPGIDKVAQGLSLLTQAVGRWKVGRTVLNPDGPDTD